MSLPTKSITINRNLRPAGALGNAGTGAISTSPLLFSSHHHHDIDNSYNPPLAIARAGGQGGQVYVYSEDAGNGVNSSYASFAGGGRQWGSNASESSENTRDSLTSYLHNPSSQVPLPSSSSITSSPPQPRRSIQIDLLTPPSSFTQSVDIPQQSSNTLNNQAFSLPLTPISASSLSEHTSSPSPQPLKTHISKQSIIPNKQERQVISLISSIFPKHFQDISNISTTLEIVTPPSNILKGFIVDHSSRTVFIHLKPTSITSNLNQRPETLSPNFSQVLRPHDPLLSISPPSPSLSNSPTSSLFSRSSSGSNSTRYDFDIRESLTALLDLSSDALEANNLILILDRNENQNQQEQENLSELLHSLMYVGGQVLKSPSKSLNGWEWDITKWVLVGMEL